MPNDLSLAKKFIKKCQKTQNLYLDLGDCGIEDLNELPELFECTNLQTLNLSTNWPEKKENVWEWSDSKNNGDSNSFKTIPPEIKQLKKLKKLIVCSDNETLPLEHAEAITSLTCLEELYISSPFITDFSFLGKLTELKTLYLNSNLIISRRE